MLHYLAPKTIDGGSRFLRTYPAIPSARRAKANMGSAGGRGTGDTGDAGASTKVSDAMLKSMVRKVARGPNRLRPAAASYPLFWLGSKRLSKSSKAANPFPNVVRAVPFANKLLNKTPTGAAGEKSSSPLIGADTLPMVISADTKLGPPTYTLLPLRKAFAKLTLSLT